MRAVILTAALILAAGARPAQPPEAALDLFLGFTDPKLCKESAAHARFLQSLIEGDANDGFRAGNPVVPNRLKPAFGVVEVKRHDGWWTIGIPVRGSLFGLPLVRIEHALPEGGDPGDVTYSFRAPVDRVERVLRARGFPARANAAVRLGPPDGYDFRMSLHPDPEDAKQSLFGCGYL